MRTVPRALAVLALLAGPSLRAQDKPAGPPAPRFRQSRGQARGEEEPARLRRPRRLQPPERERGLPPPAPGLRPVRRPLLFRRRGRPGHRHLPAPPGAAHPAGLLGPVLRLQLTPDFGGGIAVLQDAWIEFKPSPKLRVRLGKQKPPVGLERLQSATAIHFVERAFPSLLSAEPRRRHPGSRRARGRHRRLRSRSAERRARRGQRRYRPERQQGPRRPPLPLALQEGEVAAQGPRLRHRRHHGPADGAPSRLPLRRADQRDHDPHRDHRRRARASATRPSSPSTRAGSASWPSTRSPSSKVKKADGQRFDLEAKAWQATATIALTGDQASYSGVRPKKPFDPSKGQWGALELAARVHGLELSRESVDDRAHRSHEVGARALGLGRGPQLVPDPEHQAGGRLRARVLQGRRRHRRPRVREHRLHPHPGQLLEEPSSCPAGPALSSFAAPGQPSGRARSPPRSC